MKKLTRPFELSALVISCVAIAVAGNPPPLRTVHQIRSLKPEQSKLGIPVLLRGVVTTPSGWLNAFFVENSGFSVAVNRMEKENNLRSGDLVEIEGVAEPGGFAPSISARHVRKIGTSKLPGAPLVPRSKLQGGSFDSQWIKVRGVVRTAEITHIWGRDVMSLLVDTGEGQLTAQVLEFSGDPQRYVDSLITVSGACGTIYNDRRQFAGVRLFVPSLNEIKIEVPGGTDPFAASPRPLDKLFNFGGDAVPNHRVLVHGTLTYQSPGRSLYIQDHGRGLLVYTADRQVVPIGSRIEAAGFASAGDYAPVLDNAVFRVVGKSAPVEPIAADPRAMISRPSVYSYVPDDSLLVRLRGQLVEWTETETEAVLLIRKGDVSFSARLPKGTGTIRNEVGSTLEITGICEVHADRLGEPTSFRILLRSPDDIKVVSLSPWWNADHALWLLLIIAIIACIALVLVQTLRARVARQRAALQDSAQSLRYTLANLPLLALSLDNEDRVTFCNDRLLELIGQPLDAVLGLHWYSKFTSPCLRDDPAWDGPEREDALSGKRESYIFAAQGDIRLVSWVETVVLDSHGNRTGTAFIGEDISERRRIEADLKNLAASATSANRAKGEFLANMSHEIRTPINGVMGIIGLLLNTELNEQQRRYAKIVSASAESLLRVINDILDFSKIEAQKLDLEALDFDLQIFLDDFASSLALRAEEKGLELLCGCAPDVPTRLIGDPGRLRQILTNLAGNAIKFTAQGEVSVRASPVEDSATSCHIRFSVRDTGIGIPQSKISRMFQKFSQADSSTTRQYGGTGLGLAISKQLAELMGGDIGVQSEEGTGSEFWFTARLDKQQSAQALTGSCMPPTMTGVRVLIVDDNATCREILSQSLAARGLRPIAVGDGQAALSELHRATDEQDPFRLALLDRQLRGDGPQLDGEHLARAIFADQRFAGMRTIAMTSLSEAGDEQRLLNIGFSACVTKPVRQSELSALLPTILEAGFSNAASSPKPAQDESGFRNIFAELPVRVLVADDNATNREVAVGVLAMMGLKADSVCSGLEVLSQLERETYHLILMDGHMPDMDGFEASRCIRRAEAAGRFSPLGRRIPIIALTAAAMQGDREAYIQAGMDDYATKPLIPRILADLLRKWLPEVADHIPVSANTTPNGRSPEEDAAAPNGVDNPVAPVVVGLRSFDREGLLERLMGNRELAALLCNSILEDMPRQLQRLSEFVEAGDLAAASGQAHRIRGAVSNVGAEAMCAVAYEMEMAGQKGDFDTVQSRLPDLNLRFSDLRSLLEVELQS